MGKTILKLLGVAVLLLGTAPRVSAGGWGVGGFGGVSIPIAQEDGKQGNVFGARLKLSLGSLLGVEPNFTYFKNGDWSVDEIPGTVFEGATFNSLGVNLIFGATGPVRAFRFFSFVGAKYYSQNDDSQQADSRIGWDAGAGLEVGAGNVGLEVRGSFELMTLEGGGSRKWGHITGGLNLYFGSP